MRYTNLKSFERHLLSSAPHHLSHIYVVMSTDDFERKKIITHILSYLQGTKTIFSGNGEELPQILEALTTQSLFDREPILFLEEGEKNLLTTLAKELKQGLSFGFLLIGTRCKEGSLFERQGVILDLLGEKPWEREKRWTEQLQERAKASGKRLSLDAIAWMMEHLEPSYAVLSQELDKLLCFCAEKETIERADIETIGIKNRSTALWTLAEEIIWERKFRLPEWEIRDSFHPLLAQVRNQLFLGAKMHELHQQSVPFSEWNSYFPKLWPKLLEKRAQSIHHLGPTYFQKGIDLLFQIDLLSKSSPVPLEFLYDLFCFRMRT